MISLHAVRCQNLWISYSSCSDECLHCKCGQLNFSLLEIAHISFHFEHFSFSPWQMLHPTIYIYCCVSCWFDDNFTQIKQKKYAWTKSIGFDPSLQKITWNETYFVLYRKAAVVHSCIYKNHLYTNHLWPHKVNTDRQTK